MSLSALATASVVQLRPRGEHDFASDAIRAIANRYSVHSQEMFALMAEADTRREASVGSGPERATSVTDAIARLADFFPTESAAIYLAVASSKDQLKTAWPTATPEACFWSLAVFTPVLFVLLYVGKRRAQGDTALPKNGAEFPWYRTAASPFAFAVWALVVPGNPFSGTNGPLLAPQGCP